MAKGFDLYPEGYVDRTQEWNKPVLPVLKIPAGSFEAWVAATDLPPRPGARGPSACAWEILRLGATKPVKSEVRPGDPVESDEQKAYVAGVLGVLERLPARSSVVICCNAKWVVDGLNGDLDKWKAEGRLKGRKTVGYAVIWSRILEARARVNADPREIKGKQLKDDDIRSSEIIIRLQAKAKRVRPKLKARR